MSGIDQEVRDDAMNKWQYILILVFASFVGFISGSVSTEFHLVVSNIVLTGGLLLSFLGLVLMIESKILRIRKKTEQGEKTEEFESYTVMKQWMYRCGWIALILGLISQLVSIWIF
jgi:hypothetical protein